MTPSYGIIVGRFQVNDLHDSHMELFRIVRGRHQRVIVFIGVAPTGMTRTNPLDYETRRRMIQAKFPEFSCAPIMDTETDEVWSQNLDEEIRKQCEWGEVTLYGGRDSFVPHYHGKFKPVELPIQGPVSGTDIRKELMNTVLESSDFRAGIIHAAYNLRPRVIPCVDIIIARKTVSQSPITSLLRGGFEVELPPSIQILLAQKTGETLWRFVGGHAEVTTPDFETDAKREAYEETGCDINSLQYIGSALIDDWRWRQNPDKFKTLVFIGWTATSGARAQDDISNVKWFPPQGVTAETLIPDHQPIFALFQKALKENRLA
jgi:bifunctional NMN adenylyltransferase/nudix hydrolase